MVSLRAKGRPEQERPFASTMTEHTLHPDADSSAPSPAVIYAAKSTSDKRGSIPTQLADCRAAIDRAGGIVAAEFSDEGKSGWSGNRGDGLAQAKARAVALAEEHGSAELWVQHSDRISRGDGLSADHLAEVYFAMRRRGVRLRSVQDDANLVDAIRAVLIGERNNEDSTRKSQAVRAALRRDAERGKWLGGVLPGWLRGSVQARSEREGDRQGSAVRSRAQTHLHRDVGRGSRLHERAGNRA
jgi:DNA invertase Pin-like site-specific DNA recombinase